MRGPQGQSLAKFETERICCDLVYVSGLALEAAGEAWIGPPAAVGKLWGDGGGWAWAYASPASPASFAKAWHADRALIWRHFSLAVSMIAMGFCSLFWTPRS